MIMQKPPRTYIPVAVATALQFLWWLFVTMITTNETIVSVVSTWWPVIWLAVISFTFGLFAEGCGKIAGNCTSDLMFSRFRVSANTNQTV